LLTEELILSIPENLKSLKQIIIHRPLDTVNETVEPLPLDGVIADLSLLKRLWTFLEI